jgi:23S rRNA-/tRNA-specific pseudouridylate synthase
MKCADKNHQYFYKFYSYLGKKNLSYIYVVHDLEDFIISEKSSKISTHMDQRQYVQVCLTNLLLSHASSRNLRLMLSYN